MQTSLPQGGWFLANSGKFTRTYENSTDGKCPQGHRSVFAGRPKRRPCVLFGADRARPCNGGIRRGRCEGADGAGLSKSAGGLLAAGAQLDAVVMVNVYLKSMKDFKDMNDVYAEVFGEHKPARATVGVSELPKNALVEISCVASLSK